MATTHFFLWVSHGDKMSMKEREVDKYYSKIGRFVYYSEHGKTLYHYLLDKNNLDKIPKTPTNVMVAPGNFDPAQMQKLYNGLPANPQNKPKKKGQYNVFPVRPIIYMAEHDTNKFEFKYMGLYYFEINSNFELIQYRKFLDGNDLITTYGHNNISLSQIEQRVLDLCKSLNITNLQNVSLGLYACESISDAQIQLEYQIPPADIDLDLDFESIPKATMLPSSYINTPHISHFSLSIVPIDTQFLYTTLNTSWKTLAGLAHQGCGLNVLSYYGILSTSRARERAVCLTLKGTSIFSIVNYINHFLKFNEIYVVIRQTLLDGLKAIYTFITTYTNPAISYAIVFKIYDDNTFTATDGTTQYSETGHTISVCFEINSKKVIFVDPQAAIYVHLNLQDPDHLMKIITTKYNTKKFIDLIFNGYYNNLFTNQPLLIGKPLFTFNQIVEYVHNGTMAIRDVPTNIYYGGKKTKRYKRPIRSKKYRKPRK